MNDSRLPARRSKAVRGLVLVLDALEKWAVITLLVGIAVLIFSGVLSRFVFHYSIAFTEELARFLFIWGALLGAASALKTGEHGGIPVLSNRFGPRGRRVIEVFVALGVTAFMGYLVFMTSVSTMRSYHSGQISTTTEIPVWTINLGMMIAFAVGVARSIQGFLLGAYSNEVSLDAPTDETTSE